VPSHSLAIVPFSSFDKKVHFLVFDGQARSSKSLVLPKLHSSTIPYFPRVPNLGSLSSPEHSFPKERGIGRRGCENIWTIDSIPMVNYLLPEFIIIKVIYLNSGSKQTHIHFIKARNP
jgi:hypothetical protein